MNCLRGKKIKANIFQKKEHFSVNCYFYIKFWGKQSRVVIDRADLWTDWLGSYLTESISSLSYLGWVTNLILLSSCVNGDDHNCTNFIGMSQWIKQLLFQTVLRTMLCHMVCAVIGFYWWKYGHVIMLWVFSSFLWFITKFSVVDLHDIFFGNCWVNGYRINLGITIICLFFFLFQIL